MTRYLYIYYFFHTTRRLDATILLLNRFDPQPRGRFGSSMTHSSDSLCVVIATIVLRLLALMYQGKLYLTCFV